MASPLRQKSGKALAVAILLSALFVVGKPTSRHHEDAIEAEILASHTLVEPLGFHISAAYLPDYTNAILVSFTSHQGRLTSLGVLGQVWVFPRGFGGAPIESANRLDVTEAEAVFHP